uniref:Ribonuclease H-like domain, reverse transcriptase, RNA-dependent DNA polymerase n=1 Tax=Tanacetum cinerariifolium TaxID=118510 RepID=A0A6L2MWY6_TANCI|nr:ribonuclease H-like domain, reverse transcriptase, RNA-dependent DNA polymerase [Tanacetum cinerariifolium]
MLVQVYVVGIIFGSTKKELCDAFEKMMPQKFQMNSMGELTFFLGLQVKQKQDGIFISQDKYVAEILKKYSFLEVKNASTPIETQKPLLKDEDGEEVDVHMYRLMISSLMCLTSSRHDIMFAVISVRMIMKATVKAETVNGEGQLQALVDGKKVIITESTIRRDLQLEDAKGVDCLPNVAIFEQLTFMEQEKNKKPRRKDTELPHTSVPISVSYKVVNEEMDDSLERAAPTATSLDAEQGRGVNTPQSGKDSLKLSELMELCTKLQQRVLDLETIKTTQAMQIESLKIRVKKLEKRRRSRTHGLKRLYKFSLSARVESSKDKDIFGVNDSYGDEVIVEDAEMLFDVAGDLKSKDVFVSQEVPLKEVSATIDVDEVNFVSTETTTTATTNDITLAKALIEIKSAKPKTTATSTRPKAKGLVIHEQKHAPTSTVSSQQPSQVKDKGKGKLVEQEPVKKLSKKDQLKLNEELAFKQQAKEEEEERIAREKAQKIKEVNIAWDDKRRNFFVAKRAVEKRNRPPTGAPQRTIMNNYLKNMDKWKLKKITKEGSSKRVGDEMEQERSKKKKVEEDKESEELKKCLKIIPDDGDDVTIDAMPLSFKSPTIVDYKIYKEGKKNYF